LNHHSNTRVKPINIIRIHKNHLLNQRQTTQIDSTTSKSKIIKITKRVKNWLLKLELASSSGTNPLSRGVDFLIDLEKKERIKGIKINRNEIAPNIKKKIRSNKLTTAQTMQHSY